MDKSTSVLLEALGVEQSRLLGVSGERPPNGVGVQHAEWSGPNDDGIFKVTVQTGGLGEEATKVFYGLSLNEVLMDAINIVSDMEFQNNCPDWVYSGRMLWYTENPDGTFKAGGKPQIVRKEARLPHPNGVVVRADGLWLGRQEWKFSDLSSDGTHIKYLHSDGSFRILTSASDPLAHQIFLTHYEEGFKDLEAHLDLLQSKMLVAVNELTAKGKMRYSRTKALELLVERWRDVHHGYYSHAADLRELREGTLK